MPVKPNVLIVAHDAGGAEILSSWCRRNKRNRYCGVLAGPARAIFRRKRVRLPLRPEKQLEAEVKASDLVLTGTSWASDLEKEAIVFCKKHKVRVCSFLDHWVDYQARFRWRTRTVLPDEIWAGDREALVLARRTFPEARVCFHANPYFADMKEALRRLKVPGRRSGGLRILYVCEPVSEQSLKQYGRPDHWGYTEYQALEKFLVRLAGMKKPIEEIRLRLHPAESSGKYDRFQRLFPALPVRKSRKKGLLQDCLWSDWVVGCESTAMVVGLLAGKKVFSAIPASGVSCSLPHRRIRSFFS